MSVPNDDVLSSSPEYRRKKNVMKRSKIACERCKRSKRKCDGIPDLKSCTHCRKAHIECSIICASRDKSKYISKLEQKVDYLENLVKQLKDEQNSLRPARNGVVKTQPYLDTFNDTTRQSSLSSSEDDYFSSGGAPDIKMVFILRESSTNTADVIHNISTPAAVRCESVHSRTSLNFDYLLQDDVYSNKLVEMFTSITFPKIPILTRDYVNQLHQRRHRLLTSVAVDRTDMLERFQLLVIYALGTRTYQFTGKLETDFPSANYKPSQFISEAAVHLGEITSIVDLDSIQSLALLAWYMIRSSGGLSIWHMLALSMKLCVELGLHRKEVNVTDYVYSVKRRRVFWGVYVLERIACMRFRKPFTLSDYQIDVDLPYNIDDSVVNNDELAEIINKSENAKSTAVVTDLSMFISLIKLRRIHSVIRHTIYRVDVVLDLENLLTQITSLYAETQEWMASCPQMERESHMMSLKVGFHKTMRTLLVPLIPRQSDATTLATKRSVQYYIEACVNSCCQICQLAEQFTQYDWHSHSVTALNILFVSAMTIIYCVLTNRVSWSDEISSSLQACSKTLQLVGENIPAIKSQFRDPFEKFFAKTMSLGSSKKKTKPDESQYSIGGINVLGKNAEFDDSFLGSMGIKNSFVGMDRNLLDIQKFGLSKQSTAVPSNQTTATSSSTPSLSSSRRQSTPTDVLKTQPKPSWNAPLGALFTTLPPNKNKMIIPDMDLNADFFEGPVVKPTTPQDTLPASSQQNASHAYNQQRSSSGFAQEIQPPLPRDATDLNLNLGFEELWQFISENPSLDFDASTAFDGFDFGMNG
ncbi:hypothetical protein CANARDRAFT_6484 [[Candida] arabinofermentans NRRL YB-2248]|uniref:Zn(2)-C6 fungal-type domain-containing protein n=1 Tax=[Candida] arabinofermentans NRRL YB-2248 TaxID=983967 RepID=A0A1E4T586_9ASCO|nr:hypothetical protein CANARDRAFT_6484 [[Candida] arabinofermentans NRRL YB-2248]